MRLIHVVPHVSVEASGPSYSVPAMCRALGRAGADVTLMTQSKSAVESVLPPSSGFRHLLHAERGWPSKLHPSPTMRAALFAEAEKADLIHNHSIWLWPNVYAGQAARRADIPLVLAPRGTLAEPALARSRRVKRAFWTFAQRRAFDAAALYHATAPKELNELRAFGVTKPVVTLPNGIDLPAMSTSAPARVRTLLFVGRVHPIKGLDLLLDAWGGLSADVRQGWQFRIVGPDVGGHAEALQRQADTADLRDVNIVGPAFGNAKTTEYRSADLCILPSKTENFGMTVAEALAAGTPVIATKGTPWQGLETENCGWWIDRSRTALTATLVDAMSRPRDALAKMGLNGRAWMTREYGWDHIAVRMLETYEWLRQGQGSPAPDWVDTK
ncbi:MAG: glycosyltransferase [Paracoccaceae bacterium]